MIPPFVPVLAAAGVAGGVIALVAYRERRRREALEEFCLVRGYRFERERRGTEAEFAEAFPIFKRGHSRRWGVTISGRLGGREFTAFEYTYVTGGGNSRSRHRLAVVLWDAADARLPRFACTPEHALLRLAQRFGMQDIDFDDDPEFSRGYQLQGEDEAAVRGLFTRARRAYLVAPGIDGEKARRHHLAGAGTRLVWWRSGRLPKPEDLDQFLAEGDRLRRVFLEGGD